jgi:hypothetical protein
VEEVPGDVRDDAKRWCKKLSSRQNGKHKRKRKHWMLAQRWTTRRRPPRRPGRRHHRKSLHQVKYLYPPLHLEKTCLSWPCPTRAYQWCAQVVRTPTPAAAQARRAREEHALVLDDFPLFIFYLLRVHSRLVSIEYNSVVYVSTVNLFAFSFGS